LSIPPGKRSTDGGGGVKCYCGYIFVINHIKAFRFNAVSDLSTAEHTDFEIRLFTFSSLPKSVSSKLLLQQRTDYA